MDCSSLILSSFATIVTYFFISPALMASLLNLFGIFLIEKYISNYIFKVLKSVPVTAGNLKEKDKILVFINPAGLEASVCCTQYAVKYRHLSNLL